MVAGSPAVQRVPYRLDRRRGERRRLNLAVPEDTRHAERRKGDRRWGERRKGERRFDEPSTSAPERPHEVAPPVRSLGPVANAVDATGLTWHIPPGLPKPQAPAPVAFSAPAPTAAPAPVAMAFQPVAPQPPPESRRRSLMPMALVTLLAVVRRVQSVGGPTTRLTKLVGTEPAPTDVRTALFSSSAFYLVHGFFFILLDAPQHLLHPRRVQGR